MYLHLAGCSQGWTYDANGHRLAQTGVVSGTYTISSTGNRLSSITGTLARTYTYDNAGNALTFGTVTNAYYNNGRMKTAKLGSRTTGVHRISWTPCQKLP